MPAPLPRLSRVPMPEAKPGPNFFYPTLQFSKILRQRYLPFLLFLFFRAIPIMKKPKFFQRCASIMIPLLFTTIIVIVCIIVALALITDGFHCVTPESQTNSDDHNLTCLSRDCIIKCKKKSYYYIITIIYF